MADRVTLIDVSLRDGLQDEPRFVPTARKRDVLAALIAAGADEIEVTSFARADKVPQLRDADEFVRGLTGEAAYVALIFNERGFDRALAAFAHLPHDRWSVLFVVSASEEHNRTNNSVDIEQSLAFLDRIGARAREHGVHLHGGIACAYVSAFPGETIDPQRVQYLASRMVAAGCSSLNVSDSVGRADPATVATRIRQVREVADVPLGLHLHDAQGWALANIYAALEAGVRRFEGALAGLGGCPFAPDVSGNLDLERLNRFVLACGYETGIDPAKLASAAGVLRAALAGAEPLERPALALH